MHISSIKDTAESFAIQASCSAGIGYLVTKAAFTINPLVAVIDGVVHTCIVFAENAILPQNKLSEKFSIQIVEMIALRTLSSVATFALCHAMQIPISFTACLLLPYGIFLVSGLFACATALVGSIALIVADVALRKLGLHQNFGATCFAQSVELLAWMGGRNDILVSINGRQVTIDFPSKRCQFSM